MSRIPASLLTVAAVTAVGAVAAGTPARAARTRHDTTVRTPMLDFQIPRITSENVDENRGSFVIEPLDRGFGYTFGNSLRRVLLSSLAGAAVSRERGCPRLLGPYRSGAVCLCRGGDGWP